MDLTLITRTVGKAGLLLKKISPQLMLGAGVVGIITAGVLACKATIKAKDIVDETNQMLDEANADAMDRDLPEKYRRKNAFDIYVRQSGKLAKIYAPSLLIGGSSIALIVCSHVVLNRRYLGTAAAYKAIEEAFRSYRKRVANVLNEDKEQLIYTGQEKAISESIKDPHDASDEALITPNSGVILNPNPIGSPYARWFDESSPEWKKNAEYNRVFLQCQQELATKLLRINGHLFLNEVYDMLGIPRSQAGAVVGWLLGYGDDYVDFGLNTNTEGARDFINGYERSIRLDFNVDGLIYDKI